MSYGTESEQPLAFPDAFTTVALSAVADNLRLFRILAPCTVLRIGVLQMVANATTAWVVDFDRRITPGSDTGRVDKGVGTLTAPAAVIAAGEIVYKNIDPVDLNPGDEVSIQVTTAGGAGSTGLPFMRLIPRSEVPANFTEMRASS